MNTRSIVDENGKPIYELRTWYNHRPTTFASEQELQDLSEKVQIRLFDGSIIQRIASTCCSKVKE